MAGNQLKFYHTFHVSYKLLYWYFLRFILSLMININQYLLYSDAFGQLWGDTCSNLQYDVWCSMVVFRNFYENCIRYALEQNFVWMIKAYANYLYHLKKIIFTKFWRTYIKSQIYMALRLENFWKFISESFIFGSIYLWSIILLKTMLFKLKSTILVLFWSLQYK